MAATDHNGNKGEELSDITDPYVFKSVLHEFEESKKPSWETWIAQKVEYFSKKFVFLVAYGMLLIFFLMFLEALLIDQRSFRKSSIKKLSRRVPYLVVRVWIGFLDGAQLLQNGLKHVCPFQFPLVKLPPENFIVQCYHWIIEFLTDWAEYIAWKIFRSRRYY